MNGTARQPVAVGIDRSHYSEAALRYAAQMAHRQRRPLRVVHAFEPGQSSVRPLVGRSTELTGVFRNSAQRLCDEALETLAVAYPDLEVSVRLEAGPVVETLLDESETAETMVLGRRGVGGFASLLLGSSTLQVTGHAQCPVITARTCTSSARSSAGTPWWPWSKSRPRQAWSSSVAAGRARYAAWRSAR